MKITKIHKRIIEIIIALIIAILGGGGIYFFNKSNVNKAEVNGNNNLVIQKTSGEKEDKNIKVNSDNIINNVNGNVNIGNK